MRLLVIGAGASFQEYLTSSRDSNFALPLLPNFARILWKETLGFQPYYMDHFLNRNGVLIDFNTDPLELFIQLEGTRNGINTEKYFNFIWNLQKNYTSFRESYLKQFGFHYLLETVLPKTWKDLWSNIQYHGVGKPLCLRIAQSFLIPGVEFPPLISSGKVIQHLVKGDSVINLNYDTLFEVAMEQNDFQYSYHFKERFQKGVIVYKPHGSVNMMRTQLGSSKYGLSFAQANIYGVLPTQEQEIYTEIIPPIYGKDYEGHEYAKECLNCIGKLNPHKITFWGIGFTESDLALNAIYKKCINKRVSLIEFINPDPSIIKTGKTLLEIPNSIQCMQYENLEEWENAQ